MYLKEIKLLTEIEVSAIFKASQRKVQEWRKNGELPATKIGRSYVYDQNDVYKFYRDRKWKNTNLISEYFKQNKKSALASTQEMYRLQ